MPAFRAGEGVDLVRDAVRLVMQELIETEATEQIGAARYERADSRVTERNGVRPRLVSTQALKKWKRGSARWVRDVLVWSKAPFMFRTELVAVDRDAGERDAAKGELKRLGDNPVVIALVSGDATIEVAARAEDRRWLARPTKTSARQ